MTTASRAEPAARRPRDAQRQRLYLAETPLPSSPLPGLDACERFAGRVVGTLWWHQRFPDRPIAALPRFRPGQGARRAFYREDDDGPTITLPRRYRTKGVVLHELAHWALGLECGLPPHGRTFARILLDATREFCGDDRADALLSSYRAHGVHVARPARLGPDGRLRYGWDERLRLARGKMLCVEYGAGHDARTIVGRFDGFSRGASRATFTLDDGNAVTVDTAALWDVRDERESR
jgi:putative metallohydrolase (TIGR04338 family)